MHQHLQWMAVVLQTAPGQRGELDIYGVNYETSDGTAVRDYIHVSDLATAHSRCLEHLLAGGESTTLNLSTGRGHSVREVIRCAETVAGKIRFAKAPAAPATLRY